MSKNLFSRFLVHTTVLFCIVTIVSCSSSRKINYFNDLPEAEVVNLPPFTMEERIIEKGDALQISISARSAEAASFFNKGIAPAPVTPNSEGSTPTPTAGGATYVVDLNGFIEFPIIGKVRAAGVTATQLKDNLTKSLTPYLKDALVDVLFTTFNVSFLGAFGSPGVKTLPMQRTTLLEGLAVAGDLSLSGKRSDILIYRDYKGERKIYRFDMRTKDVLNNPNVFQLRHNDVLYAQIRPGVIAREDFGFVWSVVGLVVGLTTLGISIANNNK